MTTTPPYPTGSGVGALGESPEEFERRRIRESAQRADELNEAQADIPLRENFGEHEGESWDTPEMTHSAIADMKAARGPSRVAAAGLGPPVSPHRLVPVPGMVPARSEPAYELPGAPPRPLSVPQVFDENAKAELQVMVGAVVSELGRALATKFDDLRQDLEENTRLLAVMNAPMEAITDSHERAAHSFETLRREIAEISGTGSSPALEKLTQVIDTAGLSEAQSRAEARFEELARSIADALAATRAEFKASIDGVALSMLQVLHLLERLQARELREAKRRAGGGA